MADNDDNLTRRDALKTIAVGAGVIVTLPVLDAKVFGQDGHSHNHPSPAESASAAGQARLEPLKFFTVEENRTVIELTERIIPADDSSPGAREARVSEYIDLVVSLSPETTGRTWREGLALVNKKSVDMFGKSFADAGVNQQVELLKQLCKNEKSPSTDEERFFRTVKNATIDGYYTSKIGIHQELHYKGNSYLKEFTGCTHPEHQS
jgi:hypothetical protein